MAQAKAKAQAKGATVSAATTVEGLALALDATAPQRHLTQSGEKKVKYSFEGRGRETIGSQGGVNL
jgi:hypothetical protein